MPENEEIVVDDKKPPVIPPADDKKPEATEEELEERQQALNLYRALNGDKGTTILEMLAREAGILQDKGKDKEETKDLILEALQESLGNEYKFLAPKLKPALDKILAAQEEKINKRFDELGVKSLETETDSAIAGMMKDYPDFKLHVKAVEGLMDRLPPGKLTQREYLEELFTLAKAKATAKDPNSRAERLRRATNDAITKIAPSGGNDKSNKATDRPKTLKEIIADSIQEQVEAAED